LEEDVNGRENVSEQLIREGRRYLMGMSIGTKPLTAGGSRGGIELRSSLT